MDVFKYDRNVSYESNFGRWYIMNSTERRIYKEPTLSQEEAEIVFKRMYGGEELKSYASTILSKAFS